MHHRQLEYVVAIVEEGSFTQAAIRCEVAQPSLSAAVARLERDLGVPLFHRLGRRVEPTDACLALLPSARDAIRSTRAVIESAKDTITGVTGILDLAVQPTVIARVVPLVGEFHRRFPGVHVRVHSPADDSVAALVESGRSEVGIGDATPMRFGLVARPLWTEGYVCVDRSPRQRTRTNRTSTNRPTAGQSTAGQSKAGQSKADQSTAGQSTAGVCSAADLASIALVATPPGSPTRGVLDTWFAVADIAPNVSVEVDHREALVPLVAAGCGAAIVPTSVAGAAMTTGLRVRPLDPPVDRRIDVVFRQGTLTPTAQHFVGVALENSQLAVDA